MSQLVREAEEARTAQTAAPRLASPSTLAEREARVLDGLRGNRRLVSGLDAAGRAAVLAWSEEAARRIVADTAGLDDAAAEDILQPRVRAFRRMIYAVKDAAATGAAATPELVATLSRQAGLAFGPDAGVPGPDAVDTVCRAYNSAPADFASRCGVIRAFTAA
jgi:hypothetical protein